MSNNVMTSETLNAKNNLPLMITGLIALLFFIIAYFPVIRLLVGMWSDSDEYAHAFLVVPIILYMVWSKRDQLQPADRLSTAVGVSVLIAALPLYFFSLLANVNTLMFFSLIMAIGGCTAYLSGIRSFKVLFMPFLLLVLVIPIPNWLYIKLTFPLQLKVSQMSEVLIRVLDIPIYREGNIMSLPGKRFEVVEACSGMRSVVTLLTLSVIVGYFKMKKVSSKLILALCSIPIAIFVNLLRVVSMLLMYYYLDIDLSEGTWHTITGIVIFFIALFLLFSLEKILEPER